MFKFAVEARDPHSGARAGRIVTAHGEIETPVFMPVGTAGAVKTLDSRDLHELNAQIILGNTYHLYLRPGLPLLQKAGGLHGLMTWDRPLLTDSGGFQVYSLKERRKVSDEGVRFQSHIDGSTHLFTPESVMEAQGVIGSDIAMAFDECVPHPCEKDEAAAGMRRTHDWLGRCLRAPRPGEQALFGIVQGGTYDDLRAESAEVIARAPVQGCAIGGLSVGESEEEMYRVTGLTAPRLPPEKPRYLMGVGTPRNLAECVSRGIDMFDCVLPTRNARNGQVFTSTGKLHYKSAAFKDATDRPLDPACACFVCQKYSIAYLRHLFAAGEISALRLATFHNLFFYLNLMKQMRAAIVGGYFTQWKSETLSRLSENETTD